MEVWRDLCNLLYSKTHRIMFDLYQYNTLYIVIINYDTCRGDFGGGGAFLF